MCKRVLKRAILLFVQIFNTILFMMISAPHLNAAPSAAKSTRENNVSISVQVFGFSPYPMISRGVRGSYTISDVTEIEVSYLESSKTVLMSDLKYSEYALNVINRPLEMVYWGYGVGLRTVELSYSVFVQSQAEKLPVLEKGQAISGLGFIGVEVPIEDYFAIGADLFGVSAPLLWLKREDEFPDAANSFEENPRDFPYVESAFSLSFQVLRAYVKVMF